LYAIIGDGTRNDDLFNISIPVHLHNLQSPLQCLIASSSESSKIGLDGVPFRSLV